MIFFVGGSLQGLQTTLRVSVKRLLEYLRLGTGTFEETSTASHGVRDTIPSTWPVYVGLEQHEH